MNSKMLMENVNVSNRKYLINKRFGDVVELAIDHMVCRRNCWNEAVEVYATLFEEVACHPIFDNTLEELTVEGVRTFFSAVSWGFKEKVVFFSLVKEWFLDRRVYEACWALEEAFNIESGSDEVWSGNEKERLLKEFQGNIFRLFVIFLLELPVDADEIEDLTVSSVVGESLLIGTRTYDISHLRHEIDEHLKLREALLEEVRGNSNTDKLFPEEVSGIGYRLLIWIYCLYAAVPSGCVAENSLYGKGRHHDVD